MTSLAQCRKEGLTEAVGEELPKQLVRKPECGRALYMSLTVFVHFYNLICVKQKWIVLSETDLLHIIQQELFIRHWLHVEIQTNT